MKKFLLLICLMFVGSYAQAQCVAEVKDVLIDEARGSIIVETQYKLNDVIVDVKANPNKDAIGRTRYTEETGTLQEIVAKAKADIHQHCENLIIRNAKDIRSEQLKIQKDLTTPMLETLKTNAIGWKKTVTEKVVTYKNKEIIINANGTYSVSNIID